MDTYSAHDNLSYNPIVIFGSANLLTILIILLHDARLFDFEDARWKQRVFTKNWMSSMK